MIIGSGTNDNRINPVYLTGRIDAIRRWSTPCQSDRPPSRTPSTASPRETNGHNGENAFADCADGFTIYYYEGNEGWSTPEWKGYPCYPVGAIPALRGDMNGDGRVDSNDAIYLLRHVMSPERYPLF